MKKILLIAMTFVVLTLFLNSNLVTNANSSTVLPIEWEVVTLINQERDSIGLDPVVMDFRLFEAARFHSEEMDLYNYFSHDSYDETEWDDRIRDFGYTTGAISEILAYGYSTASSVVSAWMASAPHRDIIITSYWKGIGVGFAESYWTVDFGSATVDPVPIPGAVWLLGSGLIGIVGIRRKYQK